MTNLQQSKPAKMNPCSVGPSVLSQGKKAWLKKPFGMIFIFVFTLSLPILLFAQTPQGSLAANGPFCGTGSGMLTWTATSGTGPFTVVYNDGTANRTASAIASGTSFATFSPTVSITTTYTLVSVTDAGNNTRTSGFTKGSAVIIIRPKPIAVATPSSQTICSGSAITTIVLTSDINGSTINWTRDNLAGVTGSGGLSGFSGTGNISGSFSNTNATQQTIGFQATATKDGCTGSPINMSVAINQVPAADAIASQAVCNKRLTTPVNFTGNANAFTWTNNKSGIGLATTGTGNIPSFTAINNGTSKINATITVTPVINNVTPGCTGPVQTFIITINPTPILSSPTSQSVCSGTLFSYTPTISNNNVTPTFFWSREAVPGISNAASDGIGVISETLINTTNTTKNVTYVLTVSGEGCNNPDPYNLVVAVKPTPTINVSPSGIQTICNEASISPVTITNPNNLAGTTFSWSRTNGSLAGGNIEGIASSGTGNPISGKLTNTTALTDTTAFTAFATNNGCSSQKSFTIKVLSSILNNKIFASQVSEVALCGLTKQITMTTPEPKGATGNFTYQWQVSSPGNSNFTNIPGATDTALVYFTGADSYFRRIVYSGNCTDISNEKFENGPGGDLSTTIGQCTGGSGVDISVVASYVGAVYTLQRNRTGTWENVPSRSPITGTGNTITFENLSVVASYRTSVTYPGSCTETVPGIVVIDDNTLPDAPSSTAVTTPVICSGNTTNIIATVAGGAVNWYTVPVGGSPINATPIPSGVNYPVSPETTTTYYGKSIYTTTGCKSSNRTPITVTVNPTPVMTSPDSAAICTGGTVSFPLTDNVGTGTTFSWVAVDNPGTTGESTTAQTTSTLSNTITNNTIAGTSVNYSVIPTIPSTGCIGDAQQVVVSVDPVPVITSQTGSACSGATFAITPVNGGANQVPTSPTTQYTWTLPPSGSGFTGGESGSGTSINGLLTNPGTTPVTATYSVIPSGGACTGAPFDVMVTVNPTPSIVNQAATGACDGSFTLPPFSGSNKIPAGTTFSWQEPTGTNIANLEPGINEPTVSGRIINTSTPVVPVTATYIVTPTSGPGFGSCDGGTFTVVATITSSLAVNTAIWDGSVNSDWCNTANWKCDLLPDFEKDAIIPSGTPNQPVINSSCNAVARDIDVQGSATLNLQAGSTLSIFGSVVNTDPARYTLGGNVTFAGGDQDIPGFIYNGLSVTGGGTKTLLAAAIVNGGLGLNNGIMVTSNANMLTVNETGTISTGSDNSYVEGPLTRLTNSTGIINFPVGGNGEIRNAFVTPVSNAPSSYTAWYHHSFPAFNGVAGPELLGIQMNEYWDIMRNSGADAVVAMDYKNPNLLPANAATSDWSSNTNPCPGCNVAVVNKDANNKWYFTPAFPSNGFAPDQTTSWQSNTTVNSKQLLGNFGQFTFGYADATILAVQLVYFKGSLQNNNSLLEWEFAKGSDVASTEIQHSKDGRGFEKLIVLNTDNSGEFNYKHLNLLEGPHFYRLLIRDKAGKSFYSKTILVIAGRNITIIKGLRPTIVNNLTYVDIHSASSQAVSATLVDASGRTLAHQKGNLLPGDNSFRINTQMLARGMYSLRLQTADGAGTTFRIIKE